MLPRWRPAQERSRLVDDRRFKAVVLDLFDTLVTWDPSRLPKLSWNGREFHSTAGWILEAAGKELGTRFDPEAFLRTYFSVYEEINAERSRELTEITCEERFVRTLARLGFENGTAVGRRLARIHMNGVRSVTEAPAARVDAVRRIARRYRLGLVSNFDDSAAGHQIVGDTGVRELFDAVIISADVGLRKPNPLIFEKLMKMLNLEPRDILFVGDTPHDDVRGSKQLGMHAAWIRRPNKEMPDDIPPPDFVIDDLAELPDLIGC
jgi:FMN phosphatase YigB (HAD superfamily)